MSPTPSGCTFTFGQVQGGDSKLALEKHFLGASLVSAANSSAEAKLDFLLPAEGPGILSGQGVPPLSVSVAGPDGKALFSGTISKLLRSPEGTGRQVTLVYRDPLHQDLADRARFFYPSGTLNDICSHLLRGKNLRVKADDNVNHTLPAGGGQDVSLMELLGQLAAQLAAFFTYDPQSEKLRIQAWAPQSPAAVPPECVVDVTQEELSGSVALSSVTFLGRKGLKEDWTETSVAPQQAPVRPGSMGSELEAWSRAVTKKPQRRMVLAYPVPSAAKQWAQAIVSAQCAQASRVVLRVRGFAARVGDTLSIPASPAFGKGEVVVASSAYEIRSQSLVGCIGGVRS
jgi:hypothetical protein